MLESKINHSKELIEWAVEKYGDRVAVGCSWGKDSMATLHLALQVNPDIRIFSILTIHKPKETFEFVVDVVKKYKIEPRIYMVADEPPKIFEENGIETILLPMDEYKREAERVKKETGKEIYHSNPNLCCHLLKVVPAAYAYNDMGLDAWIAGLRNTEGHTRVFLNEIEIRSEKEVKINPILKWTEQEVWEYTHKNDIPVHPWYKIVFPDGRRYRSLGCAPCTQPVYDYESERDGRWRGTKKQAGECGIHTTPLTDI